VAGYFTLVFAGKAPISILRSALLYIEIVKGTALAVPQAGESKYGFSH
jgi:hypothetical protein